MCIPFVLIVLGYYCNAQQFQWINGTWNDDYIIDNQSSYRWTVHDADITIGEVGTYHGPFSGLDNDWQTWHLLNMSREFYCDEYLDASVELYSNLYFCSTTAPNDLIRIFINDQLEDTVDNDRTPKFSFGDDGILNNICGSWTRLPVGPYYINNITANNTFKLGFQVKINMNDDWMAINGIQIICNYITSTPTTSTPTTLTPTLTPITINPTLTPTTIPTTFSPTTSNPTTLIPTISPTFGPITGNPTTANPTTLSPNTQTPTTLSQTLTILTAETTENNENEDNHREDDLKMDSPLTLIIILSVSTIIVLGCIILNYYWCRRQKRLKQQIERLKENELSSGTEDVVAVVAYGKETKIDINGNDLNEKENDNSETEEMYDNNGNPTIAQPPITQIYDEKEDLIPVVVPTANLDENVIADIILDEINTKTAGNITDI